MDAGCWPDPCSPAIDSLDGLGDYDWTSTPTTLLDLNNNQLTSIEPGTLAGLTNLRTLWLGGNTALTELNLAEADLSSLISFDVRGNVNITSVSLRNTV